MQTLDVSRSSAFDLYRVATHEASQINTILCGLCGHELTWLIDLEDSAVGLLLWHHHLVSSHPKTAEARLQTANFDKSVNGGPSTKEVWLHPAIHRNRFSADQQAQIIDDFRTSSTVNCDHPSSIAKELTRRALQSA
jgi:hypothetical protein